MLTCTKTFDEIPFAHRQPKHDGHCAFIHGHNWKVTVEFLATSLDHNGFVVDFGKLHFVKEYLAKFDHALVLSANDPLWDSMTLERGQETFWIDPLGTRVARVVQVGNGSCEGLAEMFATDINELIERETSGRVTVARLTVHEDEDNSATYYAD